MDFFNDPDAILENFLSQKEKQGSVRVYAPDRHIMWPTDPDRNLVLAHDTAVELGHPQYLSTSCLYWRNDSEAVNDNRIILIGPDINELDHPKISFGRVVRICGEGFTSENAYQRYREMELVRYELHLKGYMMRAVSQYQREWARISRKALENGFSLKVLGSVLIRELLKFDYVSGVEVFFVTSGRHDVEALHDVSHRVGNILGAMGKLNQDVHVEDCDNCEFSEACDEIAALRAMRRARMN